MRTVDSQKSFLEDDLSDAPKGLFVGAVVWEAADRAEKAKERELCPFLKRLAAAECFVQARALYEFYDPKKKDNPKGEKGENAHASHFGQWTKKEFTSGLFAKYIEGQKATGVSRTNSPVNKRVFHLTYDRSYFSGGTGKDNPDHLKNQPLAFATNLRDITEKFIGIVRGDFRDSAKSALQKALEGAKQAAAGCKIPNPL